MAQILPASKLCGENRDGSSAVINAWKATSIAEGASLLLQALHSPLKVEWHVDIESCRVILSAELQDSWPPDKVSLCFGSPNLQTPRVQLSGKVSLAQLCSMIEGGVAAPSPVEDSDSRVAAPDPCIESLHIVDVDPARSILQPLSLQQWHHGACGHHALYNIRCLMEGRFQALNNEPRFWQEVRDSVAELASYGESSGRWPRSRVTGGIVDEVHLSHLVQCSELRSRISVVPSPEALVSRLRSRNSPERAALEAIRSGAQASHGFLLGAAIHWYAAVAMLIKGRPCLLFLDSYNVPLAKLRTVLQSEEIAETQMAVIRDRMYRDLRSSQLWQHRPEEHLEQAFLDGVEEWWKGIRKASMFWKHPPQAVRSELKRKEFDEVRRHLEVLSEALREAGAPGDRSSEQIACSPM